MLFTTVFELLQDYSYFILLFFFGLLGFSAGLWQQAPSLIPRRVQEKPRVGKRADREADYRTVTGRPSLVQIRNAEEFRMNTSKEGSHEIDEMEDQPEKAEPIKLNVGLRQRTTQDSSPNRAWLRSLSLGSRRLPRFASGTAQDSNPKCTPRKIKKGMQREASLTGEEVKDLADAFITRVHQRMWVQKQLSLKRHPNSPVTYAAPPLPLQ